jgi:hypothetical protein
MNIHERNENQKARGEIVMEQIAHEPRAGDKERDTSGNQGCEISGQVPAFLPRSARLTALIVTRDPYILRGMQDGENSAAIARLRHLREGIQFEQRGKHEPQKLREGESERRDQRARAHGAYQTPESQECEDQERYAKHEAQGKCEFRRQAQRKNQRIGGTASFKAREQHQVRSHKRAAQAAPFTGADFRAAAPREHH